MKEDPKHRGIWYEYTAEASFLSEAKKDRRCISIIGPFNNSEATWLGKKNAVDKAVALKSEVLNTVGDSSILPKNTDDILPVNGCRSHTPFNTFRNAALKQCSRGHQTSVKHKNISKYLLHPVFQNMETVYHLSLQKREQAHDQLVSFNSYCPYAKILIFHPALLKGQSLFVCWTVLRKRSLKSLVLNTFS